MTNTLLAWACGMVIFTVGEGLGYVRPTETSKTKPWVQWLRRHSYIRWLSKGILLIVGGIVAEWYLTDMLMPSIQQGGLVLIGQLIQLVIGAGLGLSLGKHLSERNYSMIQNDA